MASKKSFAAWSEEKQARENKTVAGKTFAQFTQEKQREQAVADYNASLVPHGSDYAGLVSDVSRRAREIWQPKTSAAESTRAGTGDPLMDLAKETVNGLGRATPGAPGGGGRGYNTVADLDPATATPGDYMAAIAREQNRYYAKAVTPDNSPLGVQRRETNRAFRTANAFMPLENQSPEAWDTYNKLYDEAVEEDRKLKEMGGRAARELPVTLPKSLAAGTLGAVRGLVNEAGYIAQGATKAQMDENAEMWRRMGREDYAQDMETAKDAQGGFQNWANFGQNYISSAAEAAAGYGKTGQALSDVAQGVGGMVPSIVSNLVVPGSGLPVMFFQASGNATEEAKAAGASDEAAAVYGTAVGAVEVLTEKMFGGIPGLGVGALDDAVENAIKRSVGNEAAQRALLFLIDALGEGVEEFTSEFGDYFLNKWLLKNDDRTIDEVGKDAMYSFLIGALTSIAMQAPVEVANMAKTSQGRKQLAQIVADQVDQQIEQPVAPQTETQIAEGPAAEPQTAQPITQALLRSIAADPEQLAQMGIDANGKTNSQIREEIRAKLLADRAAQEQAQRASALAQEMRSKPSELGWYGMPSDDPVAAPNWYNQQNVAETDEDGVPAAPAAPWYNTPQFDNYGNSEWYEGRAATQPIVEPLMQLAQEMATEQITAARDAELRAQEAAKAQAVMAAQNAQATQATIPAQQTAPAMQKPSARAAEPTTSARGTPAQAQNKPTVRAENPGLVRDEIAAKAKLTSRESRALDALGKVLGKKIQFVDMITASVTDEDGNVRHSGANAEIDGDTIRIALDSDDPFLVAAVHEVVHGIRNLDEESYQSLAKFVSRNMSEDNRKVAEWEEAHKGYSAEDIPEEIVCDAFGRMLGDEAKLQQFVQDDRNAAQKLFDALHDLLVKVQRALSGGGQKLTDNQRAVYSDLESRIETMLSLFEEALNNVSGVEGETDGVATRHSLKSTMATLNLHDEMRDGKRVWVDENGNVVTKITPKMVRSTGVGALIDIASQEWKNDNGNVIKPASITKKEADKQVAGATKLMNMILKAQDGELVWRFAGSAMFSAVKSNSDAQYGTTIDFSTVCRKTQEMMTAMSKTMVKLGRGLTKDEVIQLQKDILEENGTVPCPVCYVFSRWAGVGGILDNMLKWQNKYGHEYDDPARLNARMEELKAATKTKKDLRAFLKENDATYMDMTGEREELQAERKKLNAMRRKLAKAGNTDAVAEIDERLKVINNRVDQLGKDIKAMEDSGAPELAWLDRVRSQPTYWTQGNVPANILFNMDDAATFAEQYSLAWGYRTNRGPGAGKAILPYSDMRLGDMILGPKNGSASGNTTFKTVKDGFNSDQKRAFKNALKRTLAQNLIGGQRFQSTSDFRYDYGLDYLQVFWEAQALGSKMQTYTKVIEFAEIVAAIGGDCNLSVMPLEQGYDENGRLKFSAVTGIDIEAASKANAMYDNVQLILVGINDEHIRLALSDSTESGGNLISFVIPYHASGASINNFIRGLVQNLGESFNEEYYKDYTPIQNDSERKNATAVQKQRAEIRKKILTGYETVDGNRSAWTPSEEELQIIRGTGKDISTMSFEEMLNIERRALAGDKAAIKEYESWSAGVLWDMYQKMWVDRKSADTYGVRLSTKQAEHIMPHEYWFKDADRSHAYLNGFIFRSYCYSLGLTPRFTGIDSTGKHIGYGDFTDSPGYWKTLIDRPMYANDGTYREQQKINITELSPEMLTPEYGEKNWGGYRVAEPDEQIAEKASQRFVERAQGKRYSLKEGTDNSARDLAESQRKNYDYNQQQTETGSTLRTLGKPGKNGSPIKRSKYGVGKEIGGTVYFHRDYVDDVIPSDVYETALQALQENYPDFQFNCVEYNPKDNTVRFDEAPGFDTEREPVVGDYVRVKADGTTEKGHTDYIWHHKWLWVKDDYTGFNVRDAWEWSKQWLSTISGKTYNVNGKPYNDNAVSDGNGISRWNAQLDAYGLPRDGAAGNGRGKRYSLKTVPPVQPSSDAWQRGHDEAWFVQNGYPIYRDVAADQLAANEETGQDKRGGKHGSQITSTISTYQQVYDTIKAEHPDDWQDLRILDASSGIGLGTRIGREMGFNVTDIEPYPSKTGYQFDKKRDNAETWTVRHPDYEDYSKLEDLVADGKVDGYDYIISNAVLNVIPQDTRDELVVAMGHLLNPGGQMFVNVISRNYQGAIDSLPEVRKNDKGIPVGAVRTAEGDYSEGGNIKGRGHETFVWKTNTVQKVFSYNELIAYLRDALGDGYTVEPFTKYGMTAAMVTKDANHKYSRSGRDVLDEYVEQFGEIKRGEKPARDFSMPKRTTDKTKVSMTARTVAEAGATPESFVPTIENLAANHEFDYTPYSDEAAIGNAAQIAARKGWSRTLTDWSKEVSNGGVSKTNTAVGWALYNNAVNSGDTETALNVLDLIVKHQRNAAQAVQATRILKQLNPETQLYNAENIVADINEDLKKRLGKDAPEVEIDPDLAEQFLRAKNQDDRDKVMTRIFQNIGRQMPTTFLDRWTAWRYTAMLGNPRTIIRNISGNAGFAPVVFTKDAIATAIESAASAVTGGKIERTKGNIIGRSDLLKAAWDDYANMQEIAMGESKYSDRQAANKEIQDARKIFGNTKSKAWNKTGGRVLEGWRVLTGKAMDVTDVWFNKPQYVLAMAQYCAANGISAEQIRSGKGLEKARAYAVKEAQKATYRDTNDFSQMVSSLGKSWLRSDNAWKRGIATLGEGVLPFRKTPANILARGVEYSPIGLLKAISYDAVQVKKGNMSAADMIDDISAGLTGTGLLALGVYLAAQGLLRGRGRGDDKKKEFADLEGHQDYALELPDGTSITLDWLAPEALPVFIGANLWEAAADRKDGMKMKDVLTAVSNVSEPMLQMSMLQSLNDLLDGNTYGNEETSALMRKLSSAATSYLTQAFPTLLGQVERTNENKRMTTYTDKNRFLTSDMQYILGKISAKIPGWDFQQIPYIDAWGREDLTGTFLERAGNNFLNPSFVSKISDDDLETELVRLYDVTGENVFPERANKYITTDGERKDLNAEEYLKYATAKGRTSYAVVGGLLNSSIYKGLPDDDKAACVKYAYDYASQTAKTVVGGSIPTSYKWVKEASEGVSKGIAPETYILAMNAVKSTQGIKDKNGNTITNSADLAKMQAVYAIPGLNDNQRRYLFECFDVGKTIIGYNKTLVNQKLAEMKKQ